MTRAMVFCLVILAGDAWAATGGTTSVTYEPWAGRFKGKVFAVRWGKACEAATGVAEHPLKWKKAPASACAPAREWLAAHAAAIESQLRSGKAAPMLHYDRSGWLVVSGGPMGARGFARMPASNGRGRKQDQSTELARLVVRAAVKAGR